MGKKSAKDLENMGNRRILLGFAYILEGTYEGTFEGIILNEGTKVLFLIGGELPIYEQSA